MHRRDRPTSSEGPPKHSNVGRTSRSTPTGGRSVRERRQACVQQWWSTKSIPDFADIIADRVHIPINKRSDAFASRETARVVLVTWRFEPNFRSQTSPCRSVLPRQWRSSGEQKAMQQRSPPRVSRRFRFAEPARAEYSCDVWLLLTSTFKSLPLRPRLDRFVHATSRVQ